MDKTLDKIRSVLKDAPDVTYKHFFFNKKNMTFIFSNSVSNQKEINDLILRKIDEDKLRIKNPYKYVKDFIPNNNVIDIKLKDATYYLFSGFTLCVIEDKIVAIETKGNIYSNISKSDLEKSISGPSDSFSENYQSNIGMIRRRIKSDDLKIKQKVVGRYSKTIASIIYLESKCNKSIIKDIEKKISDIKIDYLGNSNYIINKISNTNRNILPSFISTERVDNACLYLNEGRIILMCENSNKVIVIPCFFTDFIKNPDDNYEKKLNVVLNRIIRSIAFLLTILTPAIYISLMAYNIEAIPSKLLVNLSIQKDGVPFTTVFEILSMNFMFQILRESDIRFPGGGGSAISIVGALVLGEAAVEAGIVSPITIIIVGIASVSSLSFSSIEIVNSIRWLQLLLIILSSLFGFIGVLFGCVIIGYSIISETSLKKPYLKELK